jgi:hypothetical protein
MLRYRFRFVTAILTFAIGMSMVWALNLIPRLQDVLVERFSGPQNNDLNAICPVTLDSVGDTNEIYRLLIRERFTLNGRVKLIVLQAETTGGPMSEDESIKGKWWHSESWHQMIKESMPEAEQQTLEDYLAVNRTPGSLKVFNLGINYVLVKNSDLPNDEYDQFWTKFYEKYPDSSGIIFFSNVGFNYRHDQAFLYAGRSCGGLCGEGGYILLGKVNGKWFIQRGQGLWVL